MHPKALHLLNTLTLLALTSTPVATALDPLTSSSVPSECQTICDPIVKLTSTCDVTSMRREAKLQAREAVPESDMDKENSAESDCICKNTSFDVKSVTALCASCMGQNAGSGNKTAVQGMAPMQFFDGFMFARDIDRVLVQCKFPSTSYAPSATSLVEGVQVQATAPVWTITAGEIGKSAAGRVEVAMGFWGIGVVSAGVGLGAGLVMGML
ncbi:hypothetical protein P280DRAFT_473779 [Massarina eburnea CBS 473.64]|uniref:Protein CAP22 n=1 Tax=Massarina eburnea CBS 473.64 TaxID=1395130 RepID=A0A6A6RKC1_9PLEO|nr:hypothetical protein P280DRAFT_473779 [Massarina eburnea CBS 473.64]